MLRLYTQSCCPLCERAREAVERCRGPVEVLDVETVEGMAEFAANGYGLRTEMPVLADTDVTFRGLAAVRYLDMLSSDEMESSHEE